MTTTKEIERLIRENVRMSRHAGHMPGTYLEGIENAARAIEAALQTNERAEIERLRGRAVRAESRVSELEAIVQAMAL